nr:DUF4250 domain-containing protein [uncultured Leptotrichia sp.]
MINFETKDINMLLSMLNMKLRDEFSSLSSLTSYYNVNKEDLLEKMKANGYEYIENGNQFKRI